MAIVVLPLDATAGSPVFSAQQTRQALSVLYGAAPSGRPLGATSGVRAGTPATTITLTGAGSMTWNIAAHSGVLDVQTSALAGPYAYATTGGDTGTITAADSSNPRVDIIYVQVSDNALDGSGATTGAVGYLAGTPAASPSAPAAPARSMVLATIAVPRATFGAPTATWVAPIGGPLAVTPWTAFAPTLSAVTTNPTLGTGGTAVGAYQQVGKTVEWRATITIGTSPAAGSGDYSVSLPVPPKAGVSGLGSCFIGGPTTALGLAMANGPGTGANMWVPGIVNGTTNNVVAGRTYYLFGSYEAA